MGADYKSHIVFHYLFAFVSGSLPSTLLFCCRSVLNFSM